MRDGMRWDAFCFYWWFFNVLLALKDVKTALGKVGVGIWVQSRVNDVISCNLAPGDSTTPKFGGYYVIPSRGYGWPQKVHYFFTKEDVQLGQRPDLARCPCMFPSAQWCVRSVKRKKFIRCMFVPALFLPLWCHNPTLEFPFQGSNVWAGEPQDRDMERWLISK